MSPTSIFGKDYLHYQIHEWIYALSWPLTVRASPGSTELRTNVLAVRSFNELYEQAKFCEQCEKIDLCEQRTMWAVHTERTVRTENRANSSQGTKSANSEQNEQRAKKADESGKVEGLKEAEWTVAKVDSLLTKSGRSFKKWTVSWWKMNGSGVKWTVCWRKVDDHSEKGRSVKTWMVANYRL